MNGFELALVPVLAGYLLLSQTHLYRHVYAQKTHHRVFFDPALVGVILLSLAWVIAWVLDVTLFARSESCSGVLCYPFDRNDWKILLPITGILALSITVFTNRIVEDEKGAAYRWALQNETVRGRILRKSYEEGIFIEIMLKGGRSIIGITDGGQGTPDFEGDIALIPILSGYRDSTSQQLIINTQNKIENNDDIRIVLRLDHITSISHFDPDSSDIKWEVP